MTEEPGTQSFSFREVVAPLFRELSTSFSSRGMQRRSEEGGPAHGTAIDQQRPVPLTPLPNTSILDRNQQIVVGVLLRYVNLASGWRPRLFVLEGGVLRYYKVHGPTAVNVHLLLEALRQQGELYPIGAEVAMLESHDERRAQQYPSGAVSSTAVPQESYRAALPPPQAEIHVQVAQVRLSNADVRKFYVDSGTATLVLRAETQDDRWVWCEALRGAKCAWVGLTPTAAGALRLDWPSSSTTTAPTASSGTAPSAPRDPVLQEQLAEVQKRLVDAGVDPATRAAVAESLALVERRFAELAVAEENKRRALLDLVYSLENDKRQLETAMVVEGGQARHIRSASNGQSKAAGGQGQGAGAGQAAAVSIAADGGGGGGGRGGEAGGIVRDSLDERQDSLAATGDDDEELVMSDQGPSGGEEEEGEEEEFFECEAISIRSTHSRSSSLEGDDAGLPVGYPQAALEAAPPLSSFTAAAAAGAGVVAAAGPQPGWLAAEGAPPRRRERLPPPAQRERSVSLWSLIKEMVGKDLTRVCLPVYFNEPLSALQKTAEDLEYSELLDQAAALPPASPERLLRVVAFAVSAYSSTVGRTAKPFNPLLGETYELVHAEKGFRFLAEKVSHHPTIIAARAEGRRWVFEGDADVKSKFWGRSIELKPEGVLRLTFADGDSFAWNKVTTSINNLVLGKIYVDHGGIMRVRCLTAPDGLAARIRFKETGMLFDKDPRQVRGYLERRGQRLERPLLYGHWDDAMYAELEGGRVVELWRKSPPPPEPTRYNLTKFAIELNELTPGLEYKVAPTDCRLRPDQAFTERGMWDEANAEKQRLEHKQRAARRAADRGDPLEPRWFEMLPAGAAGKVRGPDELAFRYRLGYWEERAAGAFTGCRDIFGPLVE